VVLRSPELATPIGLPAVSTSDTCRAPLAPNVTFACVVESCRHAVTTDALESARRSAARRATSSDDERDSVKLAGRPRGISTAPLDESMLNR
jgi:hypothetical protein